ncbi:DUF4126 family protein [Hansschlegelia sp. KR7-227]|uniref:DUF4126 family protein n=1 Tax=Hansschlegelia sp. KR7-227 TaxID=3400914 RepID=UPI003C109208
MGFFIAALLIGAVAGLRAMTAPVAVGWAAHFGWLDLSWSWLGLLGYGWIPYVLTVLALAELVADKLPNTPSRKVPQQFGARIVTGAISGAALGVAGGSLIGGGIAGVVGAVAGTLGGAAARGRLAAAFGKDMPAAVIEDAVAVLGALAIVASL